VGGYLMRKILKRLEALRQRGAQTDGGGRRVESVWCSALTPLPHWVGDVLRGTRDATDQLSRAVSVVTIGGNLSSRSRMRSPFFHFVEGAVSYGE
jgi:hypothetical protein